MNVRMAKLARAKGLSSPILLFFPQCLPVVATAGDGAGQAYDVFV